VRNSGNRRAALEAGLSLANLAAAGPVHPGPARHPALAAHPPHDLAAVLRTRRGRDRSHLRSELRQLGAPGASEWVEGLDSRPASAAEAPRRDDSR